jgi:SAM-dependent methyltransferase
MEEATRRRLVALNREFYRRFAADFARSRRRLQPGIVRAFARLRPAGALLDLGCGSGRIARALGELAGRVDRYLGIDFSPELVAAGGEIPPGAAFLAADLSRPGWSREVAGPFDQALALSLLHHIPGRPARLALLREAAGLLRPGGGLVLSAWQVRHVPRLAAKIRPWAEVGLDPAGLEEGDLLMTWGEGDRGRRYVHELRAEELAALCREAGLAVAESWRSDGETGDMGLYLLCRRGE